MGNFARRLWLIVFALMLALGSLTALPGLALAQGEEIIFKKVTVVDFGDDTIDGNLSRPDGQYLESRKRLRHQRLIKVRDSFRAEILQSIRGL